MNTPQKTLYIKTNISQHPQLSLATVMNQFTNEFKDLKILKNGTLAYPMGMKISEDTNREIQEKILQSLNDHGLKYTSLKYENNNDYTPQEKIA